MFNNYFNILIDIIIDDINSLITKIKL